MLTEKIFYDLSLISYFDVYEKGMNVADFINHILHDEKLAESKKADITFPLQIEALSQINTELYTSFYIKDFVDDNENSGVVYTIFSCKEADIFAFRGSEALDEVYHHTGWQDWSDNFHMFLNGPTNQQLVCYHMFQQHCIDVPFYLCGHSKGGNLAMFTALVMKEELLDQLQAVVSFNAPGITKSVLQTYQLRSEDKHFQRKLFLFENENDCISSFFEHIKHPIYIKSNMSCSNLIQLYHNHNLYSMDFEHYLIAEKKTAIPKIVYHFVNDFFVNLKEERLKRIVSNMDDYFTSSLSMSELNKVFLYHISQFTNLFEDISYDEIQTITFQDLIERRKTKNLLSKAKNKAVVTIQDIHIDHITQGIIDNYEAILGNRIAQLQEMINRNNLRITNAISSIRKNKEDHEEQPS